MLVWWGRLGRECRRPLSLVPHTPHNVKCRGRLPIFGGYYKGKMGNRVSVPPDQGQLRSSSELRAGTLSQVEFEMKFKPLSTSTRFLLVPWHFQYKAWFSIWIELSDVHRLLPTLFWTCPEPEVLRSAMHCELTLSAKWSGAGVAWWAVITVQHPLRNLRIKLKALGAHVYQEIIYNNTNRDDITWKAFKWANFKRPYNLVLW